MGQRIVCAEARIDAHRIRTGYVADAECRSCKPAVDRLWNRTGNHL